MLNKMGKIVGGIAIAPFALIALGVAYCEINKAYWDHRVKELCNKDGDITIYEKVVISKSDYPNMKFISTGQPILPDEGNARSSDPFFSTFNTAVLHKGYPEIRRYEQSIVRSNDKKILSTLVSYSRVGGDIPTGIIHPSYYSCENFHSNLNVYSSTITVKVE